MKESPKPTMAGRLARAHSGADAVIPAFTAPLFDYASSGGNCAITGGAFYTGSEYPAGFANAYFYADYCGQWIQYVTPGGYSDQTAFASSLGRSAVDLRVNGGKLYYLTRNNGGAVYRIDYNAERGTRHYGASVGRDGCDRADGDVYSCRDRHAAA